MFGWDSEKCRKCEKLEAKLKKIEAHEKEMFDVALKNAGYIHQLEIDLNKEKDGHKYSMKLANEHRLELEAEIYSYRDQINQLARFIIDEVPGEPSKSEGAVTCAIRIMKRFLNETRT